MSEWASTTLSLTPIALPWRVALERIFDYLAAHHGGDGVVPRRTVLQVVDPSKSAIVHSHNVELSAELGAAPQGMTVWRGVTAEVLFGQTARSVTFSLRSLGASRTEIEAWLPTKVYQAIFAYDLGQQSFDEQIKADLLKMSVGVCRAAEAGGFVYRMANEDSLFGPLPVESLRGYIEADRDLPKQGFHVLMAGLSTKLVPAERFEFDLGDRPTRYRHNGFYVFDLLWPD